MSSIKCASCKSEFDWNESYKQQDTPGSGPHNFPGSGDFRPRAFCPHCGSMVAEWDTNNSRDNDQWIWYGANQEINQGNELPPNPIVYWGKSIPWPVKYDENKIDMAKMDSERPSVDYLMAAAKGDVGKVVALLKEGVDVDYLSSQGESAAMLAAERNKQEVLKALVDAGTNLNNQQVNGGHTPLHLAALMGHEEAVRILLQAGADRALRNQFNFTAEENARNNGHNDLAELIKNYNGQTGAINEQVETTPDQQPEGSDSKEEMPGYEDYVKNGRISRLSLNIMSGIGLFILGWLMVMVYQKLGRNRQGWTFVAPVIFCMVMGYRVNEWFLIFGAAIYFIAWINANMILTKYQQLDLAHQKKASV